MRILQVVTRLGMGGAERVAEMLATGLVTRGHEVTLAAVAAVRDHEVARHMHENLVSGGVRVARGASTANAKVAAVETALRLRGTVERVRPDLVHLHTEIPEFTWAIAGLASRRVRRVPVVRTVHNTVLWGGWPRAGRFAERRLGAEHVVAVSEAARAAFEAWLEAAGRPPAAPVVVYNGIDMAALADGPAEPRVPPRLCFAGRFEPQKGVDVLLEALGIVLGDGAAFEVALLGDGSLAPDVARATARWPDRLTVGPPAADLRSRLDAYDAILMPSRFEGMPLLAVEAMGTGVPLLATAAPGLAEVVPTWYPGRCRPGDPAEYAALLRDFLAAPAGWRDQAVRARLETRERFSLAAMLDAYEDVYARVLS
jgi:glycosyltransferase involved in cell wall biosynthesis